MNSPVLDVGHQWWLTEAIADTKTKVFATTAGLGSGKTHGACQWHHNRVLLNKGAQFSAFITITYQKIHDAIIPTYRKVLAQYGYTEGVHFRVIKSPFPKLVYCNGHEVHFLSASKPETIIATEYSHATISEAGTIKDAEPFRLIRTRLRDGRAVAHQTLLEGVPQGNIGWYAEHFDPTQDKHWQETARRDWRNLARGFRRFRLTSYDNIYLPEGYVDNVLETYAHSPNHIQAWVYGEFVPLYADSAYANYLPQAHQIDPIDASPSRDIFLTWDFNANPIAWIAVQKIPFDEPGGRKLRYVALDEANNGHGNIDDAVVEFAQKFPPEEFGNTPIRLHGDMSGHGASHKARFSDYETIRRYLKELGYTRVSVEAPRSNPREAASVEAANRWFLQDEAYISKNCIMLNRSLVSTRWKTGTRKLDKPNGETWTHHSDAWKYLATELQSGAERGVYSENI